MKKEYDFSKGIRGKYAKAYHDHVNKRKNGASILSFAGKYKDRIEVKNIVKEFGEGFEKSKDISALIDYSKWIKYEHHK